MLSLFRDFWWLAFPLSWFAMAGWRNWLDHKARRDTLDLMQVYVRNGREAPPELTARLNRA
jgi:hypothetical protein